jgi:hypothetical protein
MKNAELQKNEIVNDKCIVSIMRLCGDVILTGSSRITELRESYKNYVFSQMPEIDRMSDCKLIVNPFNTKVLSKKVQKGFQCRIKISCKYYSGKKNMIEVTENTDQFIRDFMDNRKRLEEVLHMTNIYFEGGEYVTYPDGTTITDIKFSIE